MTSYGDLDGLWGTANKIMNQIQDFEPKLIKQTHVKKKTRQYYRINNQLKQELAGLNQRCQSWTAMLLKCTGLSGDTTTYLRYFEAQLKVGEDEPLGENGDLLEDMAHDLHEMKKGIKRVLDMENVSIDHLSTDMNPYIICPTYTQLDKVRLSVLKTPGRASLTEHVCGRGL